MLEKYLEIVSVGNGIMLKKIVFDAVINHSIKYIILRLNIVAIYKENLIWNSISNSIHSVCIEISLKTWTYFYT
jgi:hypothetical protein